MKLTNEIYDFSAGTAHGVPNPRGEAPIGRIERPQTIAVLREALDALVLLISPFAPHAAEELWLMLGHPDGLQHAKWPVYAPEVAKAAEVVVPVQINGKVRARITAPAGATDDQLSALALADPVVRQHIAGKAVRKVIIGKGPLVSIVVQ